MCLLDPHCKHALNSYLCLSYLSCGDLLDLLTARVVQKRLGKDHTDELTPADLFYREVSMCVFVFSSTQAEISRPGECVLFMHAWHNCFFVNDCFRRICLTYCSVRAKVELKTERRSPPVYLIWGVSFTRMRRTLFLFSLLCSSDTSVGWTWIWLAFGWKEMAMKFVGCHCRITYYLLTSFTSLVSVCEIRFGFAQSLLTFLIRQKQRNESVPNPPKIPELCTDQINTLTIVKN